MSEDSDSDAMGEEFPFDLSDLERETDMVIVDMDRRDDWDDRPDSPCAAGIRDVLLSTSATSSSVPRPPTSVSSGWAAAPPSSTTDVNHGTLSTSVVEAAGAEMPAEFVTLRAGEAIVPTEYRPDRATAVSGGGVEEAARTMAFVTPSDAQAHPAPRDNDDVAASSSDRALDLAPRNEDVAASGSDRALDPTQTTGITPSGTQAEFYRPVTEPVSPYRAPTPTERPELTLAAVYSAIATSVAGGSHQQATLLCESHDTPLTLEVVEMLVQAMRFSRTEATRAIHHQATAMQELGLPSDMVLAQLQATLARMLEYDATRDV